MTSSHTFQVPLVLCGEDFPQAALDMSPDAGQDLTIKAAAEQ